MIELQFSLLHRDYILIHCNCVTPSFRMGLFETGNLPFRVKETNYNF